MTQIQVTQNMLRSLQFFKPSYNDETMADLHKNNLNLFSKSDNLNRRLNPIFGIQGYDSRLVLNIQFILHTLRMIS